MSTIRFDHVSRRFPGMRLPAVDDCNLDIATGTFAVLLGPSGCGKTTLLKLVNRLYEPTNGTIFIDEADIRTLNPITLRRQIGYVIQQVGLFPHMSVAQNIAVVPRLLGWARDRIEARIDELLNLIELPPADYRQRYPAQLSGGQQQRVGLARALAADPGILLMDEPFGAIDAITRGSLQDELLRLHRKLKKTILFVTHDVEEALRLADTIVIMRAGRVVQHDTPFTILTQPAGAFVAELVGANDTMRRLSLVPITAVMVPLVPSMAPNGLPQIPEGENLRDALSLLLGSGMESAVVVQDGQPTGMVSLEQIREIARKGQAV